MSSFIFRKSLLQTRITFARNPILKRNFATHPEQNETKPSNGNGMILGLIAAGGLGYYFYKKSDDKSKDQVISGKFEQAKQAVGDKVDDVKEKYDETKENAVQTAYGAKDRLDQATENAKRSIGIKVDGANDKYEETKDKAKQAIDNKSEEAKEKYEKSKADLSQKAGEAKKEGDKHIESAKEKGQELQEKAGEKIKEAGDGVKENAK